MTPHLQRQLDCCLNLQLPLASILPAPVFKLPLPGYAVAACHAAAIAAPVLVAIVVAAVVLDMLLYLSSITARHAVVLARMLPVFAILFVFATLFAARCASGACRAVINAISANHVPVNVVWLVLAMLLYLLSSRCSPCC